MFYVMRSDSSLPDLHLDLLYEYPYLDHVNHDYRDGDEVMTITGQSRTARKLNWIACGLR